MYVMRGKLESVYKGNTAFSRASITLQGSKLLREWKFLPSFPMKFNYEPRVQSRYSVRLMSKSHVRRQ